MMVIDLNHAEPATGPANLDYGVPLIFPRLARVSQHHSSRTSKTGHHQSGHHRIPMPSPSRKVLVSLDRSNMHMRFLEPVRGRSGLAQPLVPSRAYRNRSPQSDERPHATSFGPTAVSRRLNASNYIALGANAQRPSGGFAFIINRRELDANSGMLGLLTSVNEATMAAAGCRQFCYQGSQVLVMLDRLPK